MINSCKPFTIFAKSSILDIWQGSKYPSAISENYKYVQNLKQK